MFQKEDFGLRQAEKMLQIELQSSNEVKNVSAWVRELLRMEKMALNGAESFKRSEKCFGTG